MIWGVILAVVSAVLSLLGLRRFVSGNPTGGPASLPTRPASSIPVQKPTPEPEILVESEPESPESAPGSAESAPGSGESTEDSGSASSAERRDESPERVSLTQTGGSFAGIDVILKQIEEQRERQEAAEGKAGGAAAGSASPDGYGSATTAPDGSPGAPETSKRDEAPAAADDASEDGGESFGAPAAVDDASDDAGESFGGEASTEKPRLQPISAGPAPGDAEKTAGDADSDAVTRSESESGAGGGQEATKSAGDDESTRSGPPQPVPARYPDLHLINEKSGAAQPHDRPLRAGDWYTLEVMITPEPGGVPVADGEKRVPSREPAAGKPVQVMVTLEPGDEGAVDIAEPLSSFELPPAGASGVARFRIRPLRASAGEDDRLEIMVRMYHRLNLLSRTLLVAHVGGRWDDAAIPGAITVRPLTLPPEIPDPDDVVPQDLTVDVTRRGDHFLLSVTYARPGGETVVFPAPLRIPPAELEDAMRGVRDVLTRIAATPEYTSGVQAEPATYAAHLRELAMEGRRLWTTLFLRDLGSARHELARALDQNPLAPDARVQVNVEADAAEFVFPWALLFTGEIPADDWQAPDPAGFWGARYDLELRRPDAPLPSKTPAPAAHPLKLAFLLWKEFRNAPLQTQLITDLCTRSNGRLRADPPILNARRATDLLKACDAQLLYFYTHGYTRPRRADTTVDGAGHDDPDHDRSWIALSYGKLYLDDLYAAVQQPFAAQPLVILNMCESAELTPSLSDSFVAFFLDRGARAVVGTECPMTVEFAHPFAETLLQSVLQGAPVGRALLDARRHFLNDRRNPLGLAYSLYGTASASFAPPVLDPPTR